MHSAEHLVRQAEALIDAGRFFFSRGWVPATSGNFSARLDTHSALITESGRHKGRLDGGSFLRVDWKGQALDLHKKPSAETLLHTQLYQRDEHIGAVLHTHSVNATVLSRLTHEAGELRLDDYEVLKAFPGINTHQTSVSIPIFANDQDIARLAQTIEAHWERHPHNQIAYLIAGHGLYTWGHTVADALRHVEALEFLFECELLMRRMRS